MGTIRTLGPLFAPSFHRPWLRYIDAVDGAEGGDGADGDTNEQTFTQADLDRIVKERVQRERAKYSDYDDLKAKAAGAKTVEDRLAEVEGRAKDAEARALRADIANKHGISAEDRDLFLTGDTEDVLTAQATRLAERDADQKRQGGVVRREGGNRNQNGKDDPMREFTRGLFGNNDN
jgi:hypothetical protein